MGRDDVTRWVAAYEAAWRTAGTEQVGALFAAGASYRMSPYEEPVAGLATIAELWESERDGPDEGFSMEHEIVAVDGDTVWALSTCPAGRRAARAGVSRPAGRRAARAAWRSR